MTHTKRNLSVAALILTAAFTWHLVAGSLEPTAPPGPTMKTLDQVEPRIPIPGTPGRTIAPTLVISQRGSYYLTGDRFCSERGIKIDSDNVTIDLMGYSLIGTGSGLEDGIYISSGENVEIRNGTVRGFSKYGIYGFGSVSKNYRIINIRATSNGQGGIYLLGSSHLVKDCMVCDNGASAVDSVYGIYTSTGATLTGNTVNNNGASAMQNVYGIRAGFGSVVTGNTACYNGDSAIGKDVYGIYLIGNALVDQNTAYGNGGTNMSSPTNCTFGVNRAP